VASVPMMNGSRWKASCRRSTTIITHGCSRGCPRGGKSVLQKCSAAFPAAPTPAQAGTGAQPAAARLLGRWVQIVRQRSARRDSGEVDLAIGGSRGGSIYAGLLLRHLRHEADLGLWCPIPA
jgi:hypothetical protein